MRILDLFCGAGGAGMGYHLAFPDAEIVGVDINPQPNYPFTFMQADAMALRVSRDGEWYGLPGRPQTLGHFDFVHASPPCQDHSALRTMHEGHGNGWMLAATIDRLAQSGASWVVENVEGATRSMPSAFRLCGSSFGLEVRRHRLFAASFPVLAVPCAHYAQPEPIDVTGTGGPTPGRQRTGGGVSRKPRNLDHARAAMGIDWMSRREISQAIPPAYTRYIGECFAALERAA